MTRKSFSFAASSLLFLLWLAGCATLPKQELKTARAAVAEAYAADAPQWAPAEYQAATQALNDGERLVRQGEFTKARKVLPLATIRARRALSCSETERTLYENRQAARQAVSDLPPPKKNTPKPPKAPVVEPARPAPPPRVPVKIKPPRHVSPPPTQHAVEEGETLWSIAARRDIYGDALLWPLLYKANRDQIKDPRQIYPGQVLSIPRDISDAEKEESREKARASDVFPLDQLLKNRSGTEPCK